MDSIAAILEETAARARALTDRARQALLMGRNAKALIHRLPVELLSRIFRTAAYFGKLSSAPDLPPLFDINRPIPLTHVCASWRNIVQSQPSFWNTIICRLYDENSSYSGEL